MSASLLPVPRIRFFDPDGSPLVGGKLYTYEAGTLTPKASYVDSTQVTQNTNPIILNELGEASIWISGNYKLNLTDADDVQIQGWPIDNVQDLHTADNVTATSTTSLSVSSASKTFTTQTGKYFPAGIFLLVVDDAAPSTNWMHGQVTSYVGTQLVINVTTATGSGTHADWTISLSGPVGPEGPTGGSGGGTGDVIGPASSVDGRIVLFDGTSGTLLKQAAGGAGTAAFLDVGTSANQVVQLTAAAKLPAVDGSLLTGVVVSGSSVLLATKTATAVSLLDFTEFDNTLYEYYKFEFNALLAENGLWMRFSTNGGSTFQAGNNSYIWNNSSLGMQTASPSPVNTGDSSNATRQYIPLFITGGATATLYGELKLYGAVNTGVSDTYVIGSLFVSRPSSVSDSNSSIVNGGKNGFGFTAGAVNAVRFLAATGGTITSGTIKMYGIKKA